MARKALLTPTIHQAIVQAVAGNMGLEEAARLVDIDEATVRLWIRRGEGRAPGRPAIEPYVTFVLDVKRAKAQSEASLLLRIRQIGQGGAVVQEKTTTQPDGTVIREVRRTAPQWQGLAWILERTMPQKYALQTRMDLNILVQRMADRLAEEHGVEAAAIIEEAQRLIAERTV
jgi:hypothetical protein